MGADREMAEQTSEIEQEPEEERTLKERVTRLYFGKTKTSVFFRYGLMVFDICTILFFIVSTAVAHDDIFFVVDFAIASVLIVDFAARFWIAARKWHFLTQPITLADIVVIGTLLLPYLLENYAFLRIMRALRLLRSYHVLKDLRERYDFFSRNERVLHSSLNLTVFVFFITALVYVLQKNTNPEINSYMDALYFTVTTLTTTGFGDVTLEGDVGRLLAVIIMVFGVALFLRLVQTIFKPPKVDYTCPDCGLKRHDPDAIHCKHCGRAITIETEGA
jgi:voltage-gated potassium channel